MRTVPPSEVVPGHRDFPLLIEISHDIERRIQARPAEALAERIVEAVEFVLDPVRTGRTEIAQLDNVEKTFIGLKVEHFVRDLLDAPKGVRDLNLAGRDVDIKNTVGAQWAWMIPPETYRDEEPVLLIAVDQDARQAWMGLFCARPEYLGSKNRDGKRGILAGAYPNILWLARGLPWPRNHWEGLDMARFRELRRTPGGKIRAAMFFEENVGRPVHRSVILALLFDQLDPMKRLRENGGAPDLLAPKGIALLSDKFCRGLLKELGFTIAREEHIAVVPANATQAARLRAEGRIE